MRLLQTAGAAVVMTAASFVSYAQESVNGESLRQAQGELLLQIEQLRQETQALRGLMEELSYQLGQMSSDQKTRYLDLDQRLGELVRIQKEAVAAGPMQGSTTGADLSQGATAGRAVAPAPTTPEVSDQDAYNAAFQLIRERQFEEALVAMESFVKAYPGSDLVLDARFWRGQVFDVLGRDEEAIEAFKSITLVAPEYRRILQVKVKLGKLLLKNQDVMNGRKILQEVITQAPESVEAGLASRELEKIN
ncbi:tetratricopeptide repeat protein [Litorivicinus sp.]|nr:tetratricopeptide repeat protein [Litorivicinus sp.]